MSTTASPLSSGGEPDGAANPGAGMLELYQAHARFVWLRLQQMGVRSADLEDALQEVFVIAYRRLDQFDPTRAKASTWLFGIAFNVARNFTRCVRRREAHLERDVEPSESPAAGTPEELLQRRQRHDRLAELLSRLSVEHRTTFVLFELEGMTGEAIAEQMQVPVGTVRSRLFHARKIIEAAIFSGNQPSETEGVRVS